MKATALRHFAALLALAAIASLSGCRTSTERKATPEPGNAADVQEATPQQEIVSTEARDKVIAAWLPRLQADPAVPRFRVREQDVPDPLDPDKMVHFDCEGDCEAITLFYDPEQNEITGFALRPSSKTGPYAALPFARLKSIAMQFARRRYPQLFAEGNAVSTTLARDTIGQDGMLHLGIRVSRKDCYPTVPLQLGVSVSTGHVCEAHFWPHSVLPRAKTEVEPSRIRCLDVAIRMLRSVGRRVWKAPRLLRHDYVQGVFDGKPVSGWHFVFDTGGIANSGAGVLCAVLDIDEKTEKLMFEADIREWDQETLQAYIRGDEPPTPIGY